MPDVREMLVALLCEAMFIYDKKTKEQNINPFELFKEG